MSNNLYTKLSEQRKKDQEEGFCPKWYTTAGYQMFNDKYKYESKDVKSQFNRIAKTAARHLKSINMDIRGESEFNKLLWDGVMSPSTPILANMGTDRGMVVACSGGYIPDSIDGFYSSRHEVAQLTKEGFGTSGYMGDIRPRGSSISGGGKSSGVLPVFKGFIQDMRDVAQGTARRGAFAAYLPLDHGDFNEVADFISHEPDDANIGWVVTDKIKSLLDRGDIDMVSRYQKALKLKMITGKGYWFKVDEANRHRPQMYKDLDLKVMASNLCSEIMLHSSEEYTYTCVLASMNDSKYDEWKDTDAVFWATVFLDCVCEEFIQQAEGIPGLEKAVESTKKSRALGLGQMGLHTYMQKKGIPFTSLEGHLTSIRITKSIALEQERATRWMAEKLGEPEWCKGYGVRNTHLSAIAPTKSTSIMMGGVSEGINPDPAMVYTQTTSAGEMSRVNPQLLEIMKERDVFNKKVITDINTNMGSVQHVEWLSIDEKDVFKTAFEMNQEDLIRMAAARQSDVSQGQSLNLFFSADEDPAWISHIHKLAFDNDNILSLYYITTQAGVQASHECEGCGG